MRPLVSGGKKYWSELKKLPSARSVPGGTLSKPSTTGAPSAVRNVLELVKLTTDASAVPARSTASSAERIESRMRLPPLMSKQPTCRSGYTTERQKVANLKSSEPVRGSDTPD